ncbi:MAG: hypothetical protein ABIQ55_11295 [Gemmatimonadaceae bacterium]
MRHSAVASIMACVAFAAGCTSSARDSASSPDTSAVAPPIGTSAANSGVPARSAVVDACPHDGKWALCSVERRLRQSGFVVKKVDSATVKRAGFSIKPVVFSLGQSRLEVFLYADSASMMKDVAKLDTLVVGPRGTPSQWGETPPVLIRSANLAAVILSLSPRQVERAILVLTAGPPQPGSPR